MVFSEAMTNYETWQLAETLDPRIEVRWVQPEFPTNECVAALLASVSRCSLAGLFSQ